MKIIIHAGMHKTGSSSIQDAFSTTPQQGIKYPRWASSNLCGLFILLFQNPELVPVYHGFRARGPAFLAGLPELKANWLASLIQDLNTCVDETLIFSAEDISFPGFRGAVDTMAAFFRNWTDDITVVAYARSPLSFAVSAFQQMLKGGDLRGLDVNQLWPHYRSRFSMLDEIFGEDRVIIRAYDRQHLKGGDVVQDFASIVGVDIIRNARPEANVSLSAEATALLFVQRHLGDGFVRGFDRAQVSNSAFIEKLRKIGSSKMTFSDSLWGPVLDLHAEDLRWIEARLGFALCDTPTPSAIAISGKDDLIQLANRSYGELETLLIENIRQNSRPSTQKTKIALDLLQKLSY